METAEEERKEGRKKEKEEEKCGDGREGEGGAGERDWDSMVDSTTILDIYSRVEKM